MPCTTPVAVIGTSTVAQKEGSPMASKALFAKSCRGTDRPWVSGDSAREGHEDKSNVCKKRGHGARCTQDRGGGNTRVG